MGREVRRVPEYWEHPKDWQGNLRPLHDGYAKDLAEFEAHVAEHGLREALEYYGGGPITDNYMLADVPEAERTHIQMYETCTEGTPISPVFDSPEPLARWLADTGASAFGGMTATYEQWLGTVQSGWAVSAVIGSDGMKSGVEAFAEAKRQDQGQGGAA